jgi:mannose-6-phosphate isomerase-like protein (cupin superfamily)
MFAWGNPWSNEFISTEDNMRKKITALAAGLLLMMCATKTQQSVALQAPGAGRGATPATTPAPPPGSAGIYRSDAELTATLKKGIAAANGNQSSSPIANTDQYRINIVHREKAAGALAHEGNTELHYIIEGTGVVVTGGTIVRGTGGINDGTIQGGETHAVKKGDVIIVPSGSAHWYKEVTTPITYLEVRFVAPK